LDTAITVAVTTAVVQALSVGGRFVLTETASEVVRDAYSALKSWIHDRYPGVSLESLEKHPASQARREVVREDLEREGASEDTELVRLAQCLVDLVRSQPDAARSIGVDLGVLDQADVTFGKVLAGKGATGVKIAKVIRGTLQFGDVSASSETDPPEKKV
jgi:hypothetical protein